MPDAMPSYHPMVHPNFDLLNCPLDRRVLIEASAGTGKTWTLCTLVLRLLLETECELPQILIVTFTEAATAELRSRIRARLREALMLLNTPDTGSEPILNALLQRAGPRARPKLEVALRQMEQASITTIHGFCQQVLQAWPLLCNSEFAYEMLDDPREPLSELVKDAWRRRFYPADDAWLRLMLQVEDLQASEVLKLLQALAGLPDGRFELLPSPSQRMPAEQIAESWSQLQTVFGQLRQCWRAQATQVETLLMKACEQKKLDGKSYQQRWIPGLMRKLSKWLEQPYLVLPLPDDLVKLTQTRLQVAARGEGPPAHELFELLDLGWQISTDLREAAAAERLHVLHELVPDLRAQWARRKAMTRQYGFDDLLLKLHAALAAPQAPALLSLLRAKYPAALIDEFQDTDAVQSEIFSRIYPEQSPEQSPEHNPESSPTSGLPLFLVGDPKQSIYRFRGADIFAYLRMASSEGLCRYSLGTNYRTRPELLQAVARLFARPDAFQAGLPELPSIPYPPQQAGREPGKGQLLLWHASDQTLNAARAHARVTEAVLAQIQTLLNSGTRPGAIAVLTRSNRQVSLVQAQLQAAGIPCVVYASDSVYRSREAWELDLLLEAVLWPTDTLRLKRALGTCLLGYSALEILTLEADEAGWDELLERFRDYHHVWHKRGLARLWLQLERDWSPGQRLAGSDDGARRLADLRQLIALLLEQARMPGMNAGALHDWLQARRQRDDGGDSARQMLATEADAVRILTIHRSKGLEFEIVFCPWLWDPGPAQSGLISACDASSLIQQFWIGQTDADSLRDLPLARRQLAESRAESIRLAYVALTRARESCYVAWVWQKESPRSKENRCAWSPLGLLLGLSGEVCSPETVTERLRHFAGPGLELQPMPTHTPDFQVHGTTSVSQSDLPLRVRRFRGQLPQAWQLSSYSSLSRSEAYDQAERDPERMPGGSRVGSFLHRQLQHLPFAATPEQIEISVRRELALCPELLGWEASVSELLYTTLQAPLLPEAPGLKLAAVEQAWRELPFYLPQDAELLRLMQELDPAEASGDKSVQLTTAKRNRTPGLFAGRFDLVFGWQSRYFLLDYKSAWLGSEAAYASDALAGHLQSSGQLRQGQLYALALNRLLGLRMQAYSAERDFGGVLFVFLRGLDLNQPGQGIYHLPAHLALAAIGDLP